MNGGTMTPQRRAFVHIGLPKTGTSYLQSILWRSRPALADQDLELLPSTKAATFYLMLAVRGSLRADLDPPAAFRALSQFREEAAAATGSRILVTQELLAGATRKQITGFLSALDGYQVHVVLTLRDLARHVPSAWQQHVKARGTTSFSAFLDDVVDAGSRRHPAYDPLRVLDRWSSAVPPERTHVVTVPRPGSSPEVLLERFCAVLDVDPLSLNANTNTDVRNTSLGFVQAELLRRVNIALGDRLPHPRAGYREQGKRFLAGSVLRAQGGEPPRLPKRLAPWCLERSETIRERLATEGYHVIGELDDLLPDAGAFAEEEQEATDAEVAAAGSAALASVLAARAEEAERFAALKQLLREEREVIRSQRRLIRESRGGWSWRTSWLRRALPGRRS